MWCWLDHLYTVIGYSLGQLGPGWTSRLQAPWCEHLFSFLTALHWSRVESLVQKGRLRHQAHLLDRGHRYRAARVRVPGDRFRRRVFRRHSVSELQSQVNTKYLRKGDSFLPQENCGPLVFENRLWPFCVFCQWSKNCQCQPLCDALAQSWDNPTSKGQEKTAFRCKLC